MMELLCFSVMRNKKFGELTEAIFIKELREFFYELFKDDYYKTVELELCEEYIKE